MQLNHIAQTGGVQAEKANIREHFPPTMVQEVCLGSARNGPARQRNAAITLVMAKVGTAIAFQQQRLVVMKQE